MKRIVKDIYDIKEGEKFYFDDGTKFRVVYNNKDLERFIAICEECKIKDKIGKQVTDFVFDGLNVKFTDDYISKVIDENGKEIQTERTEKKQDRIDTLLEGLGIVADLENDITKNDITNEENIDKAYDFAKKHTIEILKKENVSLESKREIIKNFKDLEESYKQTKGVIKNIKNNNNEIEDFINELEEE